VAEPVAHAGQLLYNFLILFFVFTLFWEIAVYSSDDFCNLNHFFML